MHIHDPKKFNAIHDLASTCQNYREMSDRLKTMDIALTPRTVRDYCNRWGIKLIRLRKFKPPCPVCGGRTRSAGTRYGIRGASDKFQCVDCGTRFSQKAGCAGDG